MTRNGRLALLAALGLIALFLAPGAREPPFWGRHVQQLHRRLARLGAPLLRPRLGADVPATNLNNGRFYPVFPLLLLAKFHLVHAAPLMKSLVVAAVLLNAFTFWLALRRIVPALATPALVVLPATLQIRFYHDPIVAFSLHMQLALEFVLLGFLGLATVWTERTARTALGLGCGVLHARVSDLRSDVCLCARFRGAGARVPSERATTQIRGRAALFRHSISLRERRALRFAPALPSRRESAYRLNWDAARDCDDVRARSHRRRAVEHMRPSIRAGSYGRSARSRAQPDCAGLTLGVFAALLAFAVFGRAPAPGELRFAALFGFSWRSCRRRSSRSQRVSKAKSFGASPIRRSTSNTSASRCCSRRAANALARRGRMAAVATALVLGLRWRRRSGRTASRWRSSRRTGERRCYRTRWMRESWRARPRRRGLYVDDSYPVNRQLDAANWSANIFTTSTPENVIDVRPLAQLDDASRAPRYAVLGAYEGGARGEVAAGESSVVRDAAEAPIPLVEHAELYVDAPAGKALRAYRSTCGPVTLSRCKRRAERGRPDIRRRLFSPKSASTRRALALEPPSRRV